LSFRAYRMAAGTHRLVATYEFADMGSWAAWQSHEDIEAGHFSFRLVPPGSEMGQRVPQTGRVRLN